MFVFGPLHFYYITPRHLPQPLSVYTGGMNLFFSGLGGVAIGPLAEIARDAGHAVIGTDLADNLMTDQLRSAGMTVSIGQDGSFLRACHTAQPIDWFVHTSALPEDHAELTVARELGIKTAKRDELLAMIIKEKGLKLIAVAGTHGKTTATGMLVWALLQKGIPVSYSVGSTLTFGPSGRFDPQSEYFVYECDEYDRNFLHFSPHLSLITSLDYDHPDSFPTEDDYREAFSQFLGQSDHTIIWQKDAAYLGEQPPRSWVLDSTLAVAIAGEHNRRNGTLVVKALENMLAIPEAEGISLVADFPGTDRRFEKLADNLYSDYGHHPEEIAATLQLARETTDHVVLVYQPHQNKRQYLVRNDYENAFLNAEKVYWLPTYLSREDERPILSPAELSSSLSNKEVVIVADLNDELWQSIQQERRNGALVLCMGAGTIDDWVRAQLLASNG